MDSKMRIDLEKAREIIKAFRQLNALDLNEVDIYENGAKIEVSQEIVEEHHFTGLGFVAFIEVHFGE